jgi:dTDP-4-dehydrorhamnose reductase
MTKLMQFQDLFPVDFSSLRTPVIPNTWRILMTGVTSIHGWPIFRALQRLLPSEQLLAIRSPKMQVPAGSNILPLCITDRVSLSKIRAEFRPTHVIHAAGVCDLDVCEERPAWARALNHEGTAHIADLFGNQTYILFLSTDLVFSGNLPPPGGYTEAVEPDPINVAGQTFYDAEAEIKQTKPHCIVRLGLPIGESVTSDKGAVDFVEGRFKRGLFMTLFHDEFRSCITCNEIAEILVRLLAAEPEGLFHCGGAEPVSLHGIGQAILRRGGYPEHLLKRLSRFEEVNGPPRIGNVALNSSRLIEWLQLNYSNEKNQY